MRYWFSYDLGLRGNYEDLYEWLDTMGAKECGESVATFLSQKTREQITKEVLRVVGKKARIYIISMRQGGKFVIGKRKTAPWTGYAQPSIETEDET
jgi:hypothetical protein